MNKLHFSKKQKIILSEVLMFILTYAIHIYFIFLIRTPQYVDEYRTFLIGDFLSGRYDLSLLHAYEEQNMYYGFGQVIFYIPLFWIFDSFDQVFQGALFINAAFMSMIPVLIGKIYRRILPHYNELSRLSLAFALGLFSPLIYESKTVTNETLLMFVPVLALYLLVLIYESNSKRKRSVLSALLGVTGMYMYTLNARGIAITMAIFFCVIYMEVIKKEKKVIVIPYLLGNIVIYCINYYIKKLVISNFLLPFPDSHVRNAEIAFVERLKLLKPSTFFTALINGSGNWFYILVVSGGLIVVLFVVIFGIKKKEEECNLLCYTLLSVVITCLMLFFINYNAYSHPQKTYIDIYIYGRYYDLLIPVILIVGFYFLLQYRKKKLCILVTVFSIILAGIGATTLFANSLIQTGSTGLRILNIGTFSSFMSNSFASQPKQLDFMCLSIGLLMVYILIVLFTSKRKTLILAACVGGLYMYATCSVMNSCEATSIAQENAVARYRNLVESYSDICEEYKTIYYLYSRGTQRAVNIQYALNDWRVSQIDINSDYNQNLDMLSKNAFVLSYDECFLDIFYDECYLIKEENGIYLYAYGNELANALGILTESRQEISISEQVDIVYEDPTIVVEKGESIYGPYISLEGGTYYAKVEGEYLGECSIMATESMGTQIVETNLIAQNDNKIYFEIKANKQLDDFEIRVFNNSVDIVLIQDIQIINEDGEEVYLWNGQDIYLTASLQRQYIVNEEDKLEWTPIILEEGVWEITLMGKNLADISAECTNFPEDITIEILKKSYNSVVYKITCQQYVKNPDFLFEFEDESVKIVDDISLRRYK